jgi:hypothetical protein
MNRRQVLLGCSAVLTGAVAGCAGGSDDSGGDQTPTETPSTAPTDTPELTPTPGPTPTETATATRTETPTPEPTATPARDQFVHDLNSRFTVGEEGNAVSYRIIRYYRTDRLGSSTNRSTARGTYLLVVAELTNPQEQSISVPWNDFRIRSAETWRKFDESATEKVEIDDRIDVRSLAVQGVASGRSVTGAVAFDVDPEGTYRIWITPMGGPDTPSHFVPVGEIPAVREL